MSSIISINQKSGFTGRNISINGNRVIVDGVDVTPGAEEGKNISIVVTGSVDKIDGDCASITVNGHTGSVKTSNGDIRVTGNIEGSAHSMNGSIECDGNILGDATTMNGSIKFKK